MNGCLTAAKSVAAANQRSSYYCLLNVAPDIVIKASVADQSSVAEQQFSPTWAEQGSQWESSQRRGIGRTAGTKNGSRLEEGER